MIHIHSRKDYLQFFFIFCAFSNDLRYCLNVIIHYYKERQYNDFQEFTAK
jgi:hypothetical protein